MVAEGAGGSFRQVGPAGAHDVWFMQVRGGESPGEEWLWSRRLRAALGH